MPTLSPSVADAVTWEQLAIAGVLTLLMAGIVAATIRRSLFGVLLMVCGHDVAARFWTTFATVLLVLGPLFLVFTAASGVATTVELVRRTVYLGSFGLVGAFLVMGAAVLFSAPSQAMARRRAAEVAALPGALPAGE